MSAEGLTARMYAAAAARTELRPGVPTPPRWDVHAAGWAEQSVKDTVFAADETEAVENAVVLFRARFGYPANYVSVWPAVPGETPFVERWEASGRDASLGVGHVWHRVECPAYRTVRAADCTCGGKTGAAAGPKVYQYGTGR